MERSGIRKTLALCDGTRTHGGRAFDVTRKDDGAERAGIFGLHAMFHQMFLNGARGILLRR
jgi:hypothetical protein